MPRNDLNRGKLVTGKGLKGAYSLAVARKISLNPHQRGMEIFARTSHAEKVRPAQHMCARRKNYD